MTIDFKKLDGNGIFGGRKIPGEIWRIVPDTNDVYEVSNLGNVRKKRNGYVLKKMVNNTGYYRVSITVKKIGKKVFIFQNY